MAFFQPVVYFPCLGANVLCLALLIRSYMRTGRKLLLWSALCFVGLALDNLFLIFVAIIEKSMGIRLRASPDAAAPCRQVPSRTALTALARSLSR